MKKIWEVYSDMFGRTIFHPQFIMRTFTYQSIEQAKRMVRGKLLDIGCGRMEYKDMLLKRVTSYTGFDHPKVSKLYNSKPDVLGEATNLPFPNDSFDSVLLLQVLEYISEPTKAIREVRRVLRKDGVLIVSVPFLYPLHDIPHDKLRFSKSFLKDLFKSSHFRIISFKEQGGSLLLLLQTAMLAVFRFFHKTQRLGHPVALIFLPIIVLFSVVFVPIGNAVAFLLLKFEGERVNEEFVLNYTIVAKKSASG